MQKIKTSILWILVSLIIIIVAVNTVFIGILSLGTSKGLAKAIEINRPAKLSAVIIKPKDCQNCFDIDTTYKQIKNTNVLIDPEKNLIADSKESQDLIKKYDIKKLPVIIFTGEIKKDAKLEKAWNEIGEIKNNAVIFTKLKPPYFDVATSRVVGQVSTTYINDKSCTKCPAYKQYVEQLKKAGVTVASEKTLDYRDSEAQTLIKKYKITKIPTFIFDKEIGLYDEVVKNWSKSGKIDTDGTYIATEISAPYRDLTADKIKGMVTAIYLVDKSCSECFKVSSINQILVRFGLVYAGEKTVYTDSAEGKDLIKKYNITKVPTVIADKEVDAYISLKQVWQQLGTIEKDGYYIVRNLSVIQKEKYKDLTTNKIISN